MKKFLSVILAALITLSISTVAFAHENVDNTFDYFTPGPGLAAPDNWYDPFCHDEDGHILPLTMEHFDDGSASVFCNSAKKVFTVRAQSLNGTDVSYIPYQTTIPMIVAGSEMMVPVFYCPYCGIDETKWTDNDHTQMRSVYYGFYCSNCGEFNAKDKWYALDAKQYCNHCYATYPADKFYRFVPKAYLENPEISFIFEETAADFGDGKDGYTEDLEFDKWGRCIGWNNPDEEPTELTFWQKIVQFFTNIALWFAELFSF